jgi:hypothetical protein
MSRNEPVRPQRRRTGSALVAVVSALLTALVIWQLVASSTPASPVDTTPAVAPAQARPDAPPGERHHALGASGRVPDGTTVFDDHLPAVGNLDPALLGALRAAAREAAGDGVRFSVNSGWRSAGYQQQLLDAAVTEYGSVEEARRWVATPQTSPHVSGDAVDIGPDDATAWLSEHGAAYGLCQIYVNEPWHYELRTEALDGGCPAGYADASQDPRMQQ